MSDAIRIWKSRFSNCFKRTFRERGVISDDIADDTWELKKRFTNSESRWAALMDFVKTRIPPFDRSMIFVKTWMSKYSLLESHMTVFSFKVSGMACFFSSADSGDSDVMWIDWGFRSFNEASFSGFWVNVAENINFWRGVRVLVKPLTSSFARYVWTELTGRPCSFVWRPIRFQKFSVWWPSFTFSRASKAFSKPSSQLK